MSTVTRTSREAIREMPSFQGKSMPETYLARFGAVDANVSLVFSELWVQPVQPGPAYIRKGGRLSMQANEFRAIGHRHIRRVCGFIGGPETVLPSFPMLEDFVP